MIEIIKKKISLENFKSRVPALVKTIDMDISDENKSSWGKIPVQMNVFGKSMKYGTMMKLYYSIMDTIMKSEYYLYDANSDKWLKKDIDWRDVIEEQDNVLYVNNLPYSVDDYLQAKNMATKDNIGQIFFIKNSQTVNNGETYCPGIYKVKGMLELSLEYEFNNNVLLILGVNSKKNVFDFYEVLNKIFNNDINGFDYIIEVNDILGKVIVPYFYECKDCGEIKINDGEQICDNCKSSRIVEYQPPFVPYFLYLTQITDLISEMDKLKSNSNDNCCKSNIYKEYGGDAFYNYLLKLNNEEHEIHEGDNNPPTIDIPILLTSKLYDLGVYRTYDVDIVDEDGNDIGEGTSEPEVSSTNEMISNVVRTSGESKLKSLRKPRRTVDDNGNELFVIYNITSDGNEVVFPYQKGYTKNHIIDGDFYYCDCIVDMKEFCSSKEVTEGEYNNLKYILNENEYCEGTVNNIIEGVDKKCVNDTISYGNENTSERTVKAYLMSNLATRRNNLINQLILLLNDKYTEDNILCLKQDYSFEYILTYKGVKDSKTIKTGTIYVVYEKPEIEVTYVLGGKFKVTNDKKLLLDEQNPFTSTNVNKWNGDGVWYKETFPMKKKCVETYIFDGVEHTITYDEIDFDSKEQTYYYDGIDFPRKNYILCEDIIYKSESYLNIATQDTYFKDEKMLGINFPLREKYDVVIDRGSCGAFEKHLQLSELKTWQDLENYRNGMFLNK